MNSQTFRQFYFSRGGFAVHLLCGCLTLLLLKDWLLGRGGIDSPLMVAVSILSPPVIIALKWLEKSLRQPETEEHVRNPASQTSAHLENRIRFRGNMLGVISIVAFALIYLGLPVPGYAFLLVVVAGLCRINIWADNVAFNPKYDPEISGKDAE